MNLQYNSSYAEFSSIEWKDKINSALQKLKRKSPNAKLLIDTINSKCRHAGINVTISSETKFTTFHYPKITYYTGKRDIRVIIPAYKYNSKVETIVPSLLPEYLMEESNNVIKYLSSICNKKDVSKKVIESDDIKRSDESEQIIKPFRTFEKQKFHIILAHELIHVLRYINDITSDLIEEESTIFGVEGNTLMIDGNRITENTIRSDFGYNMRINHNGVII